MKKNTTTFWFSIFLLIVIFSEEIFFGFMALTGTSVESGMKSRMAIGIATVGYLMMVSDIVNGKLNARNIKQLAVLLLVLALYVLTGYIFGGGNEKYSSYLLVYGSYCIPAAYVGMRLARGIDLSNVNKLLPFIIIPLTLIVGSNMGKYIAEKTLVNNDASGLNYQTVSYFMSFFYSYSTYYCFFSNVNHQGFRNRLIFYAMLLNMFASAVFCLFGGGRGAFVYIVFITLYLAWSLYSANKGHRGYIVFLISVLSLVFIILSINLGVWDSAGMSRITAQLTEDEVREELWNKAIGAFLESPVVGHGLGSIWWTVGYYSHNMITDLLAETGIIGTGIVLYVLSLIFIRLSILYKMDKKFIFIILIFLGSLIHVIFSGYWLSAHNLFLIYGFVFSINWRKRNCLLKI